MASCSCAQRQGLPRGHAQLPLHQVQAGDHLGDRVLHLQPGVHLHEVELAALLGDELHGAGVHVSHRARGSHRGGTDLTPPGRGHARSGRLLQHLLVAPLHRAVALEQVNRRCRACRQTPASRCGAGACRYFSISTRSSPKAAAASRLAEAERTLELRGGFDDAHALAAATGGGLDQHRIADPIGLARERVEVLRLAVIAGHQRHAGLLHQLLGRALGAHRADRARRRADEDDAAALACLGEVRVLRQETVARMDRLGTRARSRPPGCDPRADSSPGPPPRRSDALRRTTLTCSAPASASEYTATVRMPRRLQVRATRTAISPRLAMRILSNI